MIDCIVFSKTKGTLEVSVSVYVFKKPEYKMVRNVTDLKAAYAWTLSIVRNNLRNLDVSRNAFADWYLGKKKKSKKQ